MSETLKSVQIAGDGYSKDSCLPIINVWRENGKLTLWIETEDGDAMIELSTANEAKLRKAMDKK